jgi:hypothetical protein
LRVALSFAIWTALMPATASAAGPDARTLLDRAKRRFADGAIRLAASDLKQALAQADDPELSAQIELQIGVIEVTRGNEKRARAAFSRAMAHDPGAKLDPHRHRPDVVALLRRVRSEIVGELRLQSRHPSPTSIWIDGKRACVPPCSLPLMAGRHLVELRGAANRQLEARSIMIEPGADKSLMLGQAPAKKPVTRSAAAGAPSTAVQQATSRAPPHTNSLAGQSFWSRPRVWTWVTGAGAVLSGAAAVLLGLAARADYSEACGLLERTGDCADRDALANPADRERYEALADSTRGKSLAANVCWGLTGVLGAVAVVLLIVEGADEAGTTRLQVDLEGSGMTSRLSWRF